ncbi:methyltransferase [Zhongshania sp. BJYM1]|uniref:methyltransferase n=1 Tax=Zhongshania aquatica TaxID=2965069 RepID=UPI0022B33C54|nr:methyltransferase [Marortus sp. BJYM1]
MNFSQRALKLDTLLEQHQSFWRFNAYSELGTPHLDKHPALLTFLLALSDEAVVELQRNDQYLLTTLTPYFHAADELHQLITLNSPPSYGYSEPPSGIPGRKWQQIQAYIEANSLQTAEENTTCDAHHKTKIIEWCSGKGYLGQAAAKRYQLKSVGLEIDSSLVTAGNHRAASTDVDHEIILCDVLSDAVFAQIDHSTQLMALHACGGLHQRLLHVAVTSNSPELSFSPCCYHRFNNGEYRSLSNTLKHSGLVLNNQDLRTAVRQTSTARSGEITARRQLQARYLALRILLDEQGQAANTTLPSVPQQWSKVEFLDWLSHILKLKPLTITIPDNINDYEARGWQQLYIAERIDLVRMAFRRAIELRCVLDSILFLEEHEYECRLSEFCPTSLTPRNLFIRATKRRA